MLGDSAAQEEKVELPNMQQVYFQWAYSTFWCARLWFGGVREDMSSFRLGKCGGCSTFWGVRACFLGCGRGIGRVVGVWGVGVDKRGVWDVGLTRPFQVRRHVFGARE
ncbi:hypothetical protein CFELI_02865 [Corynebacterium felinum]|uniref:Uncharacterized protein n=1 Tax=Corynebacterium felinum TaxID=131318 RepID=A0ABU2B8B1_9CORY|nr:hypothetical protein [Corynebacterium felinum]WJY94215.1 hypothetical protein CFELI_02865 [Corynebacterium felinum]